VMVWWTDREDDLPFSWTKTSLETGFTRRRCLVMNTLAPHATTSRDIG
jgi:hypothetical protein